VARRSRATKNWFLILLSVPKKTKEKGGASRRLFLLISVNYQTLMLCIQHWLPDSLG
jgi:hypothetical protein